jgi:uncharacterized membrane protein
MPRIVKAVLFVAVVAVVSHIAAVRLVPLVVMDRVFAGISRGATAADTGTAGAELANYLEPGRAQLIRQRQGVNVALPAPRPNARNQKVVRPSPDLLYTACLFDVSARPLQVTAPAQDSYVSLSGFAANTDNFFVINDRQLAPGPEGRKRFNVVIRSKTTAAVPLPPGALLIETPTDRGVLLFRSLIPSTDSLEALYRYQAQQLCNPL